MIPAAAKLLGGALAIVLVGVVGEWELRRIVRNEARSAVKDDSLKKAIVLHDSVYHTETVKLKTIYVPYASLRDSARANPGDTALGHRAMESANATIQQCFVTLSACDSSLRARDARIAELEKPSPVRRLTYPAEILYDPLRGTSVLRGGVELRAFFGFSVKAEGELQQPGRAGVRVGLRKVF